MIRRFDKASLRPKVMALALGMALAAPAAALAQDGTIAPPAAIKAAGHIVVGIESTYPPMAYKDPKTNERVGFNVELVTAIAKELNIPIKWEEMSFEQLMTSLTTGRIDMIGTAISDLPSRREKLTFVDYLATGAQPFALAARAGEMKSNLDLCGKTVGAPRTTSYMPVTTAWSEKNCAAAGRPAVVMNGTAGATATRLELKQGRLDAAVLGPEYVAFLMTDEPNTYALVGEPLSKTLFGLGFDRKNVELRDAVAKATTAVMKNGAYQQALRKFGLERQALSEVSIDAGQ
jgi:polar amino acid transport system substrate-binding protein